MSGWPASAVAASFVRSFARVFLLMFDCWPGWPARAKSAGQATSALFQPTQPRTPHAHTDIHEHQLAHSVQRRRPRIDSEIRPVRLPAPKRGSPRHGARFCAPSVRLEISQGRPPLTSTTRRESERARARTHASEGAKLTLSSRDQLIFVPSPEVAANSRAQQTPRASERTRGERTASESNNCFSLCKPLLAACSCAGGPLVALASRGRRPQRGPLMAGAPE